MRPDGDPETGAESDEHLLARASRLLGRDLVLLRPLAGGTHARTLLVCQEHDTDDDTDDGGAEEYVVRAFPPGDPAAALERQVLPRLSSLGDLAPRLVGVDDEPGRCPLVLTTRVTGGPPPPDLSALVVAREMALALARVHALPGEGLREDPVTGVTTGVLSHGDFWCGNATWTGERLTGLVDWTGAGYAPRGRDVAWCRQDLVLLGSPEAAELLVTVYETASEHSVRDLRAWDVRAAEHAAGRSEEWAPAYAGIGRPEVTAAVLDHRLAEWTARLVG